MRHSDRDPEHIAVVLLTGLGDVVHGLPLINAIKDANPATRITWIAEAMPASFLAGHPSIDRLIVYRKDDGVKGIRDLRKQLKAGPQIDITLNLNVYFKSVWPTILSGAPRRIGFEKERSYESVWRASNEHLKPAPRAHTADMFLEFASHLGVDVPNPEWRIRLTAAEQAEQRAFFDRFGGRPVATIVPATASIKKDWIPVKWAQVADALEKQFGFAVVLAGGPGKREQSVARDIAAAASTKITWALGDSVRTLTWILGGSQLVLAPDTGPVHIARALNVPVIGLYGHTNPWRVGPWRAYDDLWVDQYTDKGESPDTSDRRPKWERMHTITVEQVVDRVGRAVQVYGSGRNEAKGWVTK